MSDRSHVPVCAALFLCAAPAAAQDARHAPSAPPGGVVAAPSSPLVHAATSNPGRVTPIFTNLPASPTSDVPGVPGAKFQASTTSTAIFDRPWASANGAHWVVTADTDLATTEDEVLLLDGAVAGREGTPAPWDAGQTWGPLDARIGINDAGEYAFTINVAPSTVNDDYTIHVTAGPTYNVITREANPIGALPGATWDDTIDSPVLLNDGRVSVQGDGIDGAGVVTTNDDELLVLGNAIVAREGITIPTNQAGGATNAWENFDFEDTWFDATGNHVIILGDLLGATTSDQVAVVDGAVVLQEGSIIAGSTFTSPIGTTGIAWVAMDAAGNWYARGDNADGQDWIVRNGVVLASTGSAIAPGATENWAGPTATPETFYAIAANGTDWVAMGTTDAPDTQNGVVVLNGQHVILRENDPIDLDGNGAFDDDTYLRSFGNDDLALLPDGSLIFTATIQNSLGAQTGHGLFRRAGGNLQHEFCFGDGSGTACPCANESPVGAEAGCLNSLGVGGRVDSTGIASISADTLLLTGASMPNSSALYFQGTAAQTGGAGSVFGDGLRCAAGSVVRLATKFNTAGGSVFPDTGDPSVSVRGLVVAPGTRVYQVWYRNAASFCSASTFNLTNGLQITWGG